MPTSLRPNTVQMRVGHEIFCASARALRQAAEIDKLDKVSELAETYSTHMGAPFDREEYEALFMAHPDQVIDFMYADVFLGNVVGG